ncbi:MAG: hypothetical protein MHM6MM_005976 [Cercozoa sp. M6MM]
MVRIGTLPMRLLAQEYGADMCYGEELIDHKVMRLRRYSCSDGVVRFFNPNTVKKVIVGNDDSDVLDINKNMKTIEEAVFATKTEENVVFQLGSADAARAVQAASVIANDVRAVDLNCGCPKTFSIQGGMGAALLKDPARLCDIVRSLRRNLSLPVTAKIRLLPDQRETIELVRQIAACGVSAIGVHCRETTDRPQDSAQLSRMREIVDASPVPIIHNGDIFHYSEFQSIRQASHVSSVMVARGAMWNASIFRAEGYLPVYDVASRYVSIAKEVHNRPANTKYVLLSMLKTMRLGKTPAMRFFQNAKTNADIDVALTQLAEEPRARMEYTPLLHYRVQDVLQGREIVTDYKKHPPQ